jgi:probable aminopeptidase NPEPL1
VVRFAFVKDAKAAIKGAKTVLVIARSAAFSQDRFPRIFSTKVRSIVLDAAADVKPGDLGGSASTLTGGAPRRIILGVLPDHVSRYNSTARPESIYKLVHGANLGREGSASILLILDDELHVAAALNAIGRAFPLFNAKSDEGKKGAAKKETRAARGSRKLSRAKAAKTSRAPKDGPSSAAEDRIQIAAIDVRGRPHRISQFARETMATAREAARLVDTPPTELDPAALAGAAKKLVEDLDHVTTQEIVGGALLEAGLGGIHAVGRTALSAPRLFVATYAPPSSSSEHVALVGKGITFDTGGLHLKGRGMMETMKSDMGGAAAVTGAFRVLAKLGVGCKLSLVVCIAENAIGPGSYKPDDVLRLHSGRTVEINNTDAEGRLLLADGVSYAARVLGANVVIDAATLTGAQLIATGVMHAAVMSNDDNLERLVVRAGYATGDLVHPLPFAPEFYKAEFKSTIADMRNSVKDRSNAQTSCAGQFIYNHIEDTEVRWCHIDLAGPAFRGERGTGFGVALIAEAVRRLATREEQA